MSLQQVLCYVLFKARGMMKFLRGCDSCIWILCSCAFLWEREASLLTLRRSQAAHQHKPFIPSALRAYMDISAHMARKWDRCDAANYDSVYRTEHASDKLHL